MKTELEQEFFKTFGIKSIFRYFVQSKLPVVGTDRCRPTYDLTKEQFKIFALSRAKGYKLVEVVKIYPEITDRKLLEMICICNSTYINGYTNYFMSTGRTKEKLKEEILKKCIILSKDIKNKIQQLFKEEE